MKEQIETALPRRKFVAVDNNEALKTATGHSCVTTGINWKKDII